MILFFCGWHTFSVFCLCILATVVGEMAYTKNSTGNAGKDHPPHPPRHLQTAVHLGIWMYALHQLRRGSIYFVFEMIPVKPELHFLLTI